MTFRDYINKNGVELLKISKNITKGDDYEDLFQFCILQLLEKDQKPLDIIPDKQKKYYIVKVLKNNWFSKTSPYEYKHRRKVNNNNEYKDFNWEIYDNQDEVYEESNPSIEWIREELNQLHWYKRDLFLMWMEIQSITEIAKQTTIPMNTCGRHIREIKKYLNEKWESKKSY